MKFGAVSLLHRQDMATFVSSDGNIHRICADNFPHIYSSIYMYNLNNINGL